MNINIYRKKSGFTLLELLIVIGILAIVGVIVMLIVNPAEMFKQSRDTRRMVDLKNIDSAVRLARTESIFMGNTNTVYVSVPDPALSGNVTSTCPNMGLPPLDLSWKYNCVSQENLAKNNGAGWMPVNFSSLGVGSPFASLPIDPENTTSSWRYYRYITDSKGKYIAVSGLYSDKFKPEAAKDGGNDSEKFEVGTNMSLWEESKKYYGLVRQSCAGYTNCFTSLNQWELNYSGIPFGSCSTGDLGCVDKIAVAKIDGSWTSPDTAAVAVNGWITSHNNYINIYTTTAARHSGKLDNTKYRLQSIGPREINNFEDFVRIDGLQIFVDNTQASYGIHNGFGSTGAVSDLRFSNNIIKSDNSSTYYHIGILCDMNIANTAGCRVWNNIVYDLGQNVSTRGIVIANASGNNYVYNNTVCNSYVGIYIWSNSIAKNNIVQGAVIGYAGYPGSVSDYNISNVLGNTTGGAHDKDNATVAFVDLINKDFHLSSSDTAANNAGTNLSADFYLSFTTDIDGQVRGDIWDIGADEL